MSSVAPVADSRRSAESDHRWLILVIVAIAQLMVVLDATVVNIALPSAQRALGFPNGDRQVPRRPPAPLSPAACPPGKVSGARRSSALKAPSRAMAGQLGKHHIPFE